MARANRCNNKSTLITIILSHFYMSSDEICSLDQNHPFPWRTFLSYLSVSLINQRLFFSKEVGHTDSLASTGNFCRGRETPSNSASAFPWMQWLMEGWRADSLTWNQAPNFHRVKSISSPINTSFIRGRVL